MLQDHILQAALKAISHLPDHPGLDVLDLSCGDGALLQRLHATGNRCRGSRYCEDDYIRRHSANLPATIKIDEQVDLLDPLPYEDEQFDLVVMTEVLEHLASHHSIIAEVGRILRPGGWLLFSTPNIQRVHSRWQFFLTGTHKLIRRRTGWDLSREDLYAFHTNPVSFPLIHTLLFQAGMQVTSLHWTRFKWRHAYWLLSYPILFLASHLTMRERRSDAPEFRRGERDLGRWMLHPAMLASEQLLVVAQRQPRTAQKQGPAKAA